MAPFLRATNFASGVCENYFMNGIGGARHHSLHLRVEVRWLMNSLWTDFAVIGLLQRIIEIA